jgi:hypothetical protein
MSNTPNDEYPTSKNEKKNQKSASCGCNERTTQNDTSMLQVDQNVNKLYNNQNINAFPSSLLLQDFEDQVWRWYAITCALLDYELLDLEYHRCVSQLGSAAHLCVLHIRMRRAHEQQ